MSQKTWDEQIFCTVGDVMDKIHSAEIVIVTNKNNVDLKSLIQTHIYSSKDQYLRQPLVLECTKRFPNTVQSWLEFKRMQINVAQVGLTRDLQQSFSLSGTDTAWYQDGNGTFIDVAGLITGSIMGVMPRTFYLYGVPSNGTNGTCAGVAMNGAMLIDTQHWLLYINREMNDPPSSPVWQLYDAKDGINFILNPEELKWAAIWACALSMAQDGFLRNAGNYGSAAIRDWKEHVISFCKGQYMDALWGMMDERNGRKRSDGALSLIDWDISGDGKTSDFERSMSSNETCLAG